MHFCTRTFEILMKIDYFYLIEHYYANYNDNFPLSHHFCNRCFMLHKLRDTHVLYEQLNNSN